VGWGGGCLLSGVDWLFAGLVRKGVLALVLSQGGTQQFALIAACLQVSMRGVAFAGGRVGERNRRQRVIRDLCCLPKVRIARVRCRGFVVLVSSGSLERFPGTEILFV
jgi:hypothetical protein